MTESRAYLREQQYKNDRNLALRQAIYAYQEPRVDLYARSLALAAPAGDERILDIGCGNGKYLAALARAGHRGLVAGVDLSPGMLEAARAEAGPAHLLVADAQALPFADGSFDVALAMHMLYHVPDRAVAIRELRRVTRPDGVVLVVTNSEQHLRELDDLLVAATGRAMPARHTFKMENGGSELRAVFSTVERHDFPSALLVPDAEPVMQYVRSMKAFVAGTDFEPVLGDVRSRVDSEIARVGVFRISTQPGCFVCRSR